MSGNPPTASELLDILDGADIVTVIWPDGEKNRLKDEHKLPPSIVSGRTQTLNVVTLPVANTTEAEAISTALQVLDDGNMGPEQVACLQQMLDQAREIPPEAVVAIEPYRPH